MTEHCPDCGKRNATHYGDGGCLARCPDEMFRNVGLCHINTIARLRAQLAAEREAHAITRGLHRDTRETYGTSAGHWRDIAKGLESNLDLKVQQVLRLESELAKANESNVTVSRIVRRALACGQLEKLDDARPYLTNAEPWPTRIGSALPAAPSAQPAPSPGDDKRADLEAVRADERESRQAARPRGFPTKR